MARAVLHTFECEVLEGTLPPPVRASGAYRHIEITGGLSATGSVGELEGAVTRRYRTLTLAVVCRAEEGAGERLVLDFGYRARVLELEPGRYLLRVRHTVLTRRQEGGSAAAALNVHEAEVVVPEIPRPSAADPDTSAARVVDRQTGYPRTGHD
jgi:hypothetical protein